ncbi:DeoR/GlpR family DNA-binding transcription regulator [Lacticaseibacillus thailandensis]|uniref:Glycerol-3-phosphate repressor protein n=1 Tax=Lacticaseibacillus thailandensis DSM 22698 = JCM 13996 TaxID=1423810 RepID=A0A0R2C8E3_9LACO|nr:DeoR/GlpR family DNA-binding transcription regulator [Lacticaseibacillus thailandensis]KRM87541.1 glycerol-3-phosphate repressor protein [Lacticaseibacillus thailandensis DSM 22698 = JCM 13996]
MPQSKMKPDRIKDILNILNKEHHISIAELSKRIFTSKSTLRRDLISLEEDNIVRRQYGVVYLLQDKNIEYTYSRREKVQEKAKRYICELAVKLIPNNAALFLDGSSTIMSMPDLLTDKVGLHVITNNLFIANRLNQMTPIETVMLGGILSHKSGSSVGSWTIEQIYKFKTDFALLSASTLNLDGVYSADAEQSTLKSAMIHNAKTAILMVDHSKFDHNDYIMMSNYDDIDVIITDQRPADKYVQLFEQMGIKLVYD